MVALDSGQTLELRTAEHVSIKRQTQRIQAHVKVLRFSVLNGEPCRVSESGCGVIRSEERPYLCGIFSILVSDRVDLGIGCSRVKVGFQEGL